MENPLQPYEPYLAGKSAGDRELIAKLLAANYQKLSASEKLDILWDASTVSPFKPLPPIKMSMIINTLKLIDRPWLRKAFDPTLDIRPPREKLFHPFGTLVKVEYIPKPGHPYTGMFATPTVGLARLSLALDEKRYAPSAALKFLVDGQEANNLVMDQAIDTQPSRDFFERASTNFTVWPKSFPISLGWWLINWWLSPISEALHQPLDHLAAMRSDGKAVANPKAPLQVYFFAPPEVHMASETKADFRVALTKIPANTLLYRVFATSLPDEDPRTEIGEVWTRSEFVASEFCDRILSISHTSTIQKK